MNKVKKKKIFCVDGTFLTITHWDDGNRCAAKELYNQKFIGKDCENS